MVLKKGSGWEVAPALGCRAAHSSRRSSTSIVRGANGYNGDADGTAENNNGREDSQRRLVTQEYLRSKPAALCPKHCRGGEKWSADCVLVFGHEKGCTGRKAMWMQRQGSRSSRGRGEVMAGGQAAGGQYLRREGQSSPLCFAISKKKQREGLAWAGLYPFAGHHRRHFGGGGRRIILH